jgi:hypothetical protein
VSEDYSDQLNSSTNVTFYGTGPTQIFRADGVTVTRYLRSEPDTAHDDGVTYKVTQNGSATATYTTRNGTVYESDLRKTSGSWTLYRDGAYSNSGTSSWTAVDYPYTCNAKTLTMYGPNNWTERMKRETPPAAGSPSAADNPKPSSKPSGS